MQPLRAEALRQALTTGPRPAWRAVDVVESTGSTNADLAERARAGEQEGLVLVAEHQVAGRGRRERSWEAPPRSSIAVSVLLRPAVPPVLRPWIALLGGIAVVDAIRDVAQLPATLKWPNDVLVPVHDGDHPDRREDPRKVAGLLAEVAGDAVVLGIGLNVTQDAGELPVATATSLRLAGAATTDRETVLRAVLVELAARYAEWLRVDGDPVASGLGAGYRERCSTIGRTVRVELPGDRAVEGTAQDVDDDGRLVVREEGGQINALAVGDVVHIRSGEPA